MKSWRLIIPTIALIVGMAFPAATSYATPPAPIPAPAAPTNVMAWAGYQSARVTWESPVIAMMYKLTQYQINIYQDSHLAGAIQLPAPANEKVLGGLTNFHSYNFTIQVKWSLAADPASVGIWSQPSALSNPVVPPGGVLPGAAPRLAAYATNSAALITWTAPFGGAGLTTYQVTAYQPSGAAWVPVQRVRFDSSAPTATWMRNLQNGQSYRFTVQAANTAGWGPESVYTDPAITPSTTALAAPIISSIVPGDGSLTVSWAGWFIPGVDHYVVLITRTDGRLVTYRDGGLSPLTITGLTNGLTYIVEVRAVTTQHLLSTAARGNAVIPTQIQPAAPANLRFALNDRAVSLYWDTPIANPNAPIDHYAVWLFVDAVQAWTNQNVHATSIAVPGLVVGKSYVAEVRSVSTGNVMSDPAMVRFTAATVPGAPANVHVTYNGSQAIVTWTRPTFDGASPITGYVVRGTPGLGGISLSTMVGPNQFTAAFGGLMLGQTYTFSVQALNAVGAGLVSAPSNPVTIATVPGPPRNLTVTAGDESATVRWDPPATDGGSGILSYQVTAWDGVHAPIVVVVAGTSVTLTGLTNGVPYTISVVARNALGVGDRAGAITTPRNLAPTIAVPAGLTVDYGDVVNGTVTATGPEPSDHLVLNASGLPNGVTFTDKGNGSGVLGGYAGVPAGTYPVTFTVNDGHNAPVSQSMVLTVNREQAAIRLFPTAPLSVVVKTGQKEANSLTVRATIREVTDPNEGAGDIGEAYDVTYTLTSVHTGASYSGKAITTAHGVEAAMVAKYTFRHIPRGMYELRISIGGNFYQGTAEAMIAVSSPAVRGGVSGTGEVAVPANNSTASFRIEAQRAANGKLSGSLLYTERRGAETYTFRATSVTALVFKGHTAYVQGRGTLNGVGGFQFVATIVDNHHQGGVDRFGLRVIDPSFTTVNHCTFGPVSLNWGQARIVHT